MSQLQEAYAPFPSFDDMAWYALAYVRVHQVFALDGFLRVAKEIFHWCWDNGWDTSNHCGGGVWFDQNHGGKATIENAQLYQLAVTLARLSNGTQEQQDFKGKAEKLWNFLTKATGLVDLLNFKVLYT